MRGSLTSYLKTLGKRALLAGIQQSAVVPAAGYKPLPYQTGYESVVGLRLDGDYTFVAKQSGKVIDIKEDFVQVEYKDGTKDGFKLGTEHGEVAGKFVKHVFVTDRSVGNKFVEGDVIAWNNGFFERDFQSASNVLLKHSTMVRVALVEGNDTIEDGCAIDVPSTKLFSTTISKQRAFPIKFTEEIHNLLEVGTDVLNDDVLLTIVDNALSGDIQDSDLKTLSRFQRNSPKAKLSGKISGLQIMYKGDVNDIQGPNLKALVKRLDAKRKKSVQAIGLDESLTNMTNDDVYFGGELVTDDTVVVRFFLDAEDDLGIGSKIVIGNQLKSVVGRRMEGICETEDGKKVNIRFGWKSANARIVFGVLKSGVVSTTQVMAMGKFVSDYEK